jgi:ABC-2 type transport system ATP-binding protein
MTLGDAAEPLVHIKDLRMSFGDTTVTKDLSCDARGGETFGFLGSNGSGETTTLRALLGIYQHTAEYGKKLSIAGTFRRKELAAK